MRRSVTGFTPPDSAHSVRWPILGGHQVQWVRGDTRETESPSCPRPSCYCGDVPELVDPFPCEPVPDVPMLEPLGYFCLLMAAPLPLPLFRPIDPLFIPDPDELVPVEVPVPVVPDCPVPVAEPDPAPAEEPDPVAAPAPPAPPDPCAKTGVAPIARMSAVVKTNFIVLPRNCLARMIPVVGLTTSSGRAGSGFGVCLAAMFCCFDFFWRSCL